MSDVERFRYALAQAKIHLKDLKKILCQGPKRDSILALDTNFLMQEKITDLVLDFDGVLAPHGALEPLPQVKIWLKELVEAWSGSVYVLTNKPLLKRESYFQLEFPSIQFIHSPRKKPYPDGLHHVLEISEVTPKHIMLVDDRLLTGILSAFIVKIKPLWITKPFINWLHPVTEGFFQCLRILERLWVRFK